MTEQDWSKVELIKDMRDYVYAKYGKNWKEGDEVSDELLDDLYNYAMLKGCLAIAACSLPLPNRNMPKKRGEKESTCLGDQSAGSLEDIPSNYDLAFQKEEEFHVATTAQLIRLQNAIQRGTPEAEEMFKKLDLIIKARNDVNQARIIVRDNLDGGGM
ncbi:hypothetical protein Tco_0205548 [Tanacetum coccineum]